MPAYAPQPISTLSKSLTATGSTDVVNVTEAGVLSAIGIRTTAAADGTPTMTLDITIDGGTTQHLKVYTAATSFDPSLVAFNLNGTSGAGAANGVVLVLGTAYKTSLQVAANVTGASTSTGTVQVSVLRGKQL